MPLNEMTFQQRLANARFAAVGRRTVETCRVVEYFDVMGKVSFLEISSFARFMRTV